MLFKGYIHSELVPSICPLWTEMLISEKNSILGEIDYKSSHLDISEGACLAFAWKSYTRETKLFVGIHQTRTWSVQLRISLFFSHVTRNPTASWSSMTKLTLRKRWEVSLQEVTFDWNPGWAFWPASMFAREKLWSFTWQAQSQVAPCLPHNWAEAAAGCSSGSRMLSRFVSIANEA